MCLDNISEFYLSYETIIEIRFDVDQWVELPSFTACFTDRHLTRKDQMRSKFLHPKNATEEELNKFFP